MHRPIFSALNRAELYDRANRDLPRPLLELLTNRADPAEMVKLHELFYLLLRDHLFLRSPYLDDFSSSALHSKYNRLVVIDMSTPSSTSRSTPLRQLGNYPRSMSVREQAEIHNMSTFTPCNSISDIPRLTIKGTPYILESLLRNKHSRNRYSWVWQHGTALLNLSNETTDKKTFWLYNRCDKRHKIILFNTKTTSTAADYLYTHHKINKLKIKIVENTSSPSTKTIEIIFSKPSKRPRISTVDVSTNL